MKSRRERWTIDQAPASWTERTSTRSGLRATSGEPLGSALVSSEERTFNGSARFQPRGVLGRGGMGVVYRVHDSEMGREVALKTLPSLSVAERLLLKEEFRAVASLAHPNLIELYELVVDGEETFFTMELLDGRDFVAHVRGSPRRGSEAAAPPRGAWLDRLLDALGQLVAAVDAIHRAGQIHRDIKPSNVLVTSAGRAVLLDFGVALAAGVETHGEMVGTPEYMAPEQMWGEALTPAADFYALGATLFEAVVGRVAFSGELAAMIDAKSRRRTRRPAELAEGVPAALDALVMALLDPDPSRRATGEDVVRVLAELGAPVVENDSPTMVARDAPFLGRDAELSTLRAAFARVAGGAVSLVRIEGASGIGKTELIRRFVSEMEVTSDLLLLRGRCHPQESVPYKAFDGMIDALSRALGEWPEEQQPTLPARLGAALLRLFPALSGVASLASSGSESPGSDPQEVRRLAFQALGELLAAVARVCTPVLWIDDMQWGDPDSVLLLGELLRGPPVLFLVAYRSEDVERSTTLRDLDAAARHLRDGHFSLRLRPLEAESAHMLAATLLGKHLGANEAAVAQIAAEASGSPFFIAELARAAARAGQTAAPGAAVPRCLTSVLQHRISRLGPRERRLLDIVAVAGGPIDRSVALRVAGLGEQGRPDAVRLGRACVFRSTELEGRPAVETYHDRIREAVLADLSPHGRARCHLALATTLRALPSPDPESLFRHYLGAGDEGEAAHFALAAADRASDTLAFDRAADLYQRGGALAPRPHPRARTLERLADNLVNAGRGAEAPPFFLEAAELRSGQPLTALSLRRQAAEQLVRTGRVDQGTKVFENVLRDVGVTMPRSSETATLRTAIAQVRLLVRGTGFRPGHVSTIPPRVVERLDARWGACGGLGMMNPPVASALATEHLLDALDVGEPARIAYGLSYQAVLQAAIGGPLFGSRAGALLVKAEALADSTADPTLRGFAAFARGSVAWQSGRFEEALRSCDEAIAIYSRECRGTAWHHVAAENYALSALAFLGDLRTLEVRRQAALRRAALSGDTFGAAIFRIGQLALARLGDDDPDGAITDAEGVAADWPLRLYHQTVITAQAELYRREPAAAARRLESAWSGLDRHRILALEFPRIELLFLRGRSALGHAAAWLAGRGREPAPALAAVAGWAGKIERSSLPPAAPFAASLRAGLAWLGGDSRRTGRFLRAAAQGFDAAHLSLHAAATRVALGHIDPRHAAEVAPSRERMGALGVQKPGRLTAMLVPWLPAPFTTDPPAPLSGAQLSATSPRNLSISAESSGLRTAPFR